MVLRTVALLGVGLTMVTMRVFAAAPADWNQHYPEVKAKCIAASDLLDAKALDFTGFGDEIGYDVERIEGRFKSGAVGHMVCLFNRTTRKTVTTRNNEPISVKVLKAEAQLSRMRTRSSWPRR